MNTKTISVISIIALLLIAFITNPSKQKHVDKSVEVLFNDDVGILGSVSETVYKPIISPKLRMDNYYIFSISHLNLKENNNRMNIGLGLFGQVLSIVEENDLKQFNEVNSTKRTEKNKSETSLPNTNTKPIKKEIDQKTKDRLDGLIGGESTIESKDEKGTLDGY